MGTLRTVITVLFVLVCIAITIIVLSQEGKQSGLSGSISGAAESYWGKNKGRSTEVKVEKFTMYLTIAFFVFAVVLNLNF